LDCTLSDFEENDSPIGDYMDDQKSAALLDDRFLLHVLLVALCVWAVLVILIRPL